jgi:hypothetical protein
MRLWPELKRTEKLVLELRTEIAHFERSTPNVFAPIVLKTVHGSGAANFVKLFGDFGGLPSAPHSEPDFC